MAIIIFQVIFFFCKCKLHILLIRKNCILIQKSTSRKFYRPICRSLWEYSLSNVIQAGLEWFIFNIPSVGLSWFYFLTDRSTDLYSREREGDGKRFFLTGKFIPSLHSPMWWVCKLAWSKRQTFLWAGTQSLSALVILGCLVWISRRRIFVVLLDVIVTWFVTIELFWKTCSWQRMKSFSRVYRIIDNRKV